MEIKTRNTVAIRINNEYLRWHFEVKYKEEKIVEFSTEYPNIWLHAHSFQVNYNLEICIYYVLCDITLAFYIVVGQTGEHVKAHAGG